MDIFNEVVGRHMGGQLIPVTRFGSTMQTFTPQWVVKDMIELLPDQVWNEHTIFLDISCKTGIFLVEIYKKLDEVLSKNPKYVDTATRRSHILNEQLYGLALDDKECLWYSSRNVYGRIGAKNMKYLHAGSYSYDQLVKNKKVEYMKALIQEEFGRNMFDVVVGNPPYNNDIYLDFVTLAKAIQTQNVCMITPAKWQAKGGPKNEAFRKEIVPYMSKIVYCKYSRDIFDIWEHDGISYYLMDKEKHSTKMIAGKCSNKSFEWKPYASNDCVLLSQIHKSIISKAMNNNTGIEKNLEDYIRYSDLTYSGEATRTNDIYIEMVGGNKVIGYIDINRLATRYKLDKYKISNATMVGYWIAFDKTNNKTLGIVDYNIVKPYQVPKGSYPVIRYFDTEDEAVQFKSYMKTKLVAFLFYCGIQANTINNSFYRYIPEQEAYDHIFTDQELYKKYNLTDEEINIIESVIKERK